MAFEAFWRLAHWMRTDWRFLGPLLAVNALGMVFGWYYYADVGQFDLDDLTCSTAHASAYCQPAWLWPLVADSPNALLVFTIAVVAYKVSGWRRPWLDAAAFVLNVYVGLWTTVLFLGYPDRMGTFHWGGTNNILFFTHMGMPLQALLVVPELQRDAWRWRGILLFLLALAAYVAVDYVGPMLHPAPFLHPDDALLHELAPWLMLVAAGFWFLTAAPWSKVPHAR